MTGMKKSELQDVAQQTLEKVRARGVGDVCVVTDRSRSVTVTYRKGRPEKVQESAGRSLTLHLYLDGKYTVSDTNDLRPSEIDRFLDSSVALCRAMSPDTYREIPDPALYQGRRDLDLELLDPAVHTVTTERRHEYAKALEQCARQEAGANVVSVEASWNDFLGEIYRVHSNGFEGYKCGSQFWGSAELSIGDEGGKKPSGSFYGGARHLGDLPSPEEVGRQAAKNALDRIGAKKISSERLPMIVQNRAVSGLLGQLLEAITGRAVQQNRSFLSGTRGEMVGSSRLDLRDMPFLPKGFGSRLFDSEGIAAREIPIILQGRLENIYLDTYYAKKLGREPTSGSRSNLVLTPGSKSPDDLVSSLDRGILVRGFIGGNSNPTTGDFSMGVYGTLIENGAPAGAVAEMNIAGNHNELWQRLVDVGNDPYPYSALVVPSIVFDDMQFAGA